GAACTNFTEIAQTGSTTFSNSGLTASTLYRYRVFAGGSVSNVAEATTFPPAPTGLTATATSSSQVNLSWTSSHTSFRVERCGGSGCTNFAQVATTASPSYSDSGLTASTLYRYRVFAGGSVSNVAEATTFPPAPTGLTATATSSSQVNLTWTSNYTSFRVERCAGSGCTNFAQIATTASPSYSDSGLTASTLYRYRVFAGGSVSNVAEATTFPPAPTGLTATATSSSQINLSWSGSASSFTVERCTGAGCTNFVALDDTSAKSFSDTGLTASTLYRYRVLAGGSASNITEATTFPPAPTGLTATATSSSQINLSWSGTASSFTIERCTGTGCTNFVALDDTSAKSFSDTGLTASTLYRYRVLAGGSASNIAEATTFPPAPTGLTATATSSSQIDLSWTSSHTSFRVERCAGSGCTNFAPIATASSPSYSDSGLTASTLYRYRVFAGGSASNIAEATTFPPAPTGLTATATSSSQINLSWSGSASSFTVERCTGTGCTNFVALGDTTAKSFSDSGLTASTSYRYRVLAGGSASNIAEATTYPPAPIGLTATAASATRIDLSWTSGETAFVVERCTGDGCTDFGKVADASGTTFSDSGLTASTLYRYRVLAGGSASNIAEATTLPVAAELTATAVSPTQIDLTWTSGESSFSVERCTGSGCTNFVEVAETSSTNYSDTGLTPDTLYRYRVAAGGSASEAVEATTLPAAPPAELTASAISTSEIELSWTGSDAPFRIERCTGSGCTNFAQIGETSGTTFVDSGLAEATLYRFRILGASGAASNIAEDSTRMTPPAAPTGLTATVVSATRVDLSWTDNSDNEVAFFVQRCTGAGCTNFGQIAKTTSTTFSNRDLVEKTTYRYRVVAYNAGGNALSNVVTATTPAAAPAAPVELIATPVSSTRVDLAWSAASANETGFRIERCAGAGCTGFAPIGETTGTTFSNTGLAASTVYRYRVRAFNTAGESLPSNVSEVTTPAAPPPAGPLQLDVATGSASVTVTWTSTTATQTLQLQQWNGSAWSVVQQTSGQSGGTYVVPNPAQGTLYAFRAQHLDASGNVVATSNNDAALLTTFTDEPLAPGTRIKALHMTQLVTATNQYRAAFGLAPVSLPNAAAGRTILAADVVTLRNAINQARAAAGLQAAAFSAIAPKVSKIRATDIQQLRAALR
ncbi:MAG TPA: fibronectin type III domain-containing protein, partial [Thermoanaerobaculia bacterium]